jgi:hypothetical protein
VDLPISGPSNRFLTPQADQRWPHVLSALLVVATVVVAALGLVGWPRLKSTAIHYQLINLRAEVARLEQRERGLQLELERERSPEHLAERARSLGLVPPAPTGWPAPAPSSATEGS